MSWEDHGGLNQLIHGPRQDTLLISKGTARGIVFHSLITRVKVDNRLVKP